MANEIQNVTFLSIAQFKEEVGETTLEVLRNPNTKKLFLAGTKSNWKVELALDPSKEMKILIADGDIDDACLVNVKPGAEVIVTL